MSGYLQALADVRSHGVSLEPGSPEEQAALERFRRLFAELSEKNIRDHVREVYADDVYFNDTLKEIRGVDALEPYLIESARAVESCLVEVEDVASHDGNYYLRWTMDIVFKRLEKGRRTHSIGMSHLRFDASGKILLHQDYWDSARGLFEHVPVLGYGIRKIRERL